MTERALALKIRALAIFATMALTGSMLAGCAPAMEPIHLASASASAIRGVGYAAISIQPGKTKVQKQLMAIRASRLAAMRELAEKVYGLDVNSYSSVSETVMQADTLRGSVSGLVRNARTVSIGPIKTDIYETILEIDAADVVSMSENRAPTPR
jgi:hypothetical protein